MLIEPNIGRRKACNAKKLLLTNHGTTQGALYFLTSWKSCKMIHSLKKLYSLMYQIITVFRALNDYYK